MTIKKVAVVGGGVLGSQIGYQTAFCGFDVTFWLRSEGSVDRAKVKIDNLYQTYKGEIEAAKNEIGNPNAMLSRGIYPYPTVLTEELVEQKLEANQNAYDNIKYCIDMAEAFKDADLVIESLTENPDDKIAFYTAAADKLEEKTILVTNSSTMLPSMFASYTGRPEKYFALHFANTIWKNNTAEVMKHAGTEQQYFDEVVEFASAINMIPLKVNKEQPGYILNSLLVPFLEAAQQLNANEVADPETIDLTWKLGTGAPVGPFQIIDIVGLKTCYDIGIMNPLASDPESVQYKACKILKEKIDEGKTGIAAGEGFYKYK